MAKLEKRNVRKSSSSSYISSTILFYILWDPPHIKDKEIADPENIKKKNDGTYKRMKL
jgi:hypothetical protein